MSLISLLWGLAALLGMFIAFIPILGILNWFVVPFAGIGIILGYLSKNKSGEEQSNAAKTGYICSIVALVLSMFRLFLGGGII